MNREAGFTLLEMLVALVVFGLVMAGIAQTFQFGLSAWRAGPARTAEPEALAAMDGALTRMVEQSLPGSMTGYADQFAFTAKLPPGAGLGDHLADIAILAVPPGRLILRYRQHPAGAPLVALPPPQVETLAQGIIGFSLAYYVHKPGTPPRWVTKWKGAGLPILIRLHVALADGRDWPDLILAPAATGS